MSLHLLTSYGSGDDSDSSNEEPVEESSSPIRADVSNKTNEKSAFFLDDNDVSSDEEQITPASHVATISDEPPLKKRLPSAAAVLTSKRVGSSVFMSEQQREEHLHNATLSQHVPLSEQQKPNGRSKQICKAFRRGECRRGNNCRYTHPSAAPPEQVSAATLQGGAKMYTSSDGIFNKTATFK